MDLFSLLGIMRRRRWLIFSVALVTVAVMAVRVLLTAPVYEARVKLQLTEPQQEDVALFERYRSITVRDEMTVVRNNFTEVLQSREVTQRTIAQLGLVGDDAAYALNVRPIRDADFVYVTVETPKGQLAEAIANAHVAAAIAYYGEVRAKPAAAAKNALAEQLRTAETQLHSAEAAFTEFKIQNSMMGLDNEFTIFQGLLQKLQEERSRRLIEGPSNWEIQMTETLIDQLFVERERASAQGNAAAVTSYNQAIDRYQARLQQLRETTSATDHIDSVIAKRRDELERLVMLEPRYTELRENVAQARKNYDLLLNKYTEAGLTEITIKNATYIQVVESASAPAQPAPSGQTALLVLALVGSLGLGVVLAFAADYIISLAAVSSPKAMLQAVQNQYQTQEFDRDGRSSLLVHADGSQRIERSQ